jgi:hypothetical protein
MYHPLYTLFSIERAGKEILLCACIVGDMDTRQNLFTRTANVNFSPTMLATVFCGNMRRCHSSPVAHVYSALQGLIEDQEHA